MARTRNGVGSEKRIPNAQLAIWCCCQPSTVHVWRVNKKIPSQAFLKIAKATGIPMREVMKAAILKREVSLLEEKYIEQGKPFKHISGRDYYDERKPFYKEVQERLANGC